MKAQVRAALRSMMLGIVAGIFLIIAMVFALVGVYGSLSVHMPPWQAGGWVALGALAVCFLLLLMARSGGRRAPAARRGAPRVRRPEAEDLEATAELGAAASTAARDFVRAYRPSGLELSLAAFIVGMVVSRGRRPRR